MRQAPRPQEQGRQPCGTERVSSPALRFGALRGVPAEVGVKKPRSGFDQGGNVLPHIENQASKRKRHINFTPAAERLAQNVVSLWSARRNPTVSPVPLVVSVQNYNGEPYVSSVVFANDGNWGGRERVNYAFMPFGPYVDTVNIRVGLDNKKRISGFWNFVAKIEATRLVPQTCETFLNPAKVAATAFLESGDAKNSEYIYENFVDYYQVGPLFTSAKWRNAVYRSVGANFAFSSREHKATEPVDAAAD